MIIKVNGESEDVSNDCNILVMLEELGYANQRIAVEINGEIIPKSTYELYKLHQGDAVEVVHAIGGGFK